MKIKILTFDKHFESPEIFEQRAAKVVATLGEITDLSVQFEDGVVFFKFEYSDKPAEQEFYILSWLDRGNAEGILNASVSQIEANGKTVSSVDLTFFSTRRVLASILVKVDRQNGSYDKHDESKEIITEEQGSSTKDEEPQSKQDKELDAQPVEGAKRSRRSANRRPPSGGT